MNEAQPDPPRRRRRLRWPWHVGIWTLVLAMAVVIALVLSSMALTGRVLVLPQWITDNVAQRMNAEMQSGAVTLGRVEFGMTSKGWPRFRLVNLAVRDASGLEIAQLNGVEAGLKPGALLKGQLEPSTLYLSGAQITLRRRTNGEFDLSFGQGGVTSGDLAGVLDVVDRAFTAGPLALVNGVRADALTISLEDARSGRIWQVTDGQLELTQTEKIVDIAVTFAVFNQTEELAEVALGFRSAKGSSEASIGATFSNAAARDIAAQTPVLAFLGLVDAPIAGALRTSIDADGQISDLAGTLELGSGALSPSPGAKPVKFDGAKVYIDYDPTRERLDFVEIALTSEIGEARGAGYAYFRDFEGGWPNSLLGQFTLTGASVNPRGVFAEPVVVNGGAVDFRLRLDPFSVDIGQMVVTQAGDKYRASGRIAADQSGWRVAIDAETDHASKHQVMALWPVSVGTISRKWVEENVLEGELSGARASLRLVPGGRPHIMVGTDFSGATIQAVPKMNPIRGTAGYLSIDGESLHVVAEAGQVTAPTGGKIDVTGTVFSIPDMIAKPAPAEVRLRANSSITAALSLLDAEPFKIFRESDFGPGSATGQAAVHGDLSLILKEGITPKDVTYDISADLRSVRSDVLVPDKVLELPQADLRATNAEVTVSGDGRVGAVDLSGTWRQLTEAQGSGVSKVEGWVELSQDFVREFDIELPDNTMSGRGRGQISIELAQNAAPKFTLQSNLSGIGLEIADLGWSLPQPRTGRFLAEGRMGDSPSIDRLELEAPGLSASGRISIAPGGGLEEARFDRVKIGGWLDAPVVFTGRGDRPAAISVTGGRADLRKADFTGGSGGGGDASPIRVVLDRLTISEGVDLTNFAGDFNRRGGLNGTFSALVAGGPAIRGVLAPQPNGSAFRLTSSDAGAVLDAAGVFRSVQSGELEVILAPRKGEGVYEGELKITDARVKDAPALAGLLSAISVIGILEQLDGQGLHFPEVDARFRLTPDIVTLYSSSAVGPSIGLSMDGTYSRKNVNMDMQGVVSPFYLVNALGGIFTRKGEGLIGFNFNLKGNPEAPEVIVNPLSILTPGMFREIFRRPAPKIVN